MSRVLTVRMMDDLLFPSPGSQTWSLQQHSKGPGSSQKKNVNVQVPQIPNRDPAMSCNFPPSNHEHWLKKQRIRAEWTVEEAVTWVIKCYPIRETQKASHVEFINQFFAHDHESVSWSAFNSSVWLITNNYILDLCYSKICQCISYTAVTC